MYNKTKNPYSTFSNLKLCAIYPFLGVLLFFSACVGTKYENIGNKPNLTPNNIQVSPTPSPELTSTGGLTTTPTVTATVTVTATPTATPTVTVTPTPIVTNVCYSILDSLLAVQNQGSHLWVLYSDSKDWFGARQSCINKGGHLATINSLEEDTIVRNMVGANNNASWLGGHDITNEGTFRWLTDEPFENHDSTNSGWGISEPNNDINNEQCFHFYPLGNGQVFWNDWLCSHTSYYVCEFGSGVSDTGEALSDPGVRACGGQMDICAPVECLSGTYDACGVCDGDDSNCKDCSGVPNGDDKSCEDCNGLKYGPAVSDACGECEGDGSSCI